MLPRLLMRTGDVNMEPESPAAAAGDDEEDSDGDEAEMEELYKLAKQFAENNSDRQRTMGNMTDYDVMFNELVVTMKNTPSEDVKKMMHNWINMKDNDYYRELQREEVSQLMEDCDALIDLLGAGDESDEVEDQPAPSVAAI